MKKSLSLLVAFLLTLVCFCGCGETESIPNAQLILTDSEKSLLPGEEYELRVLSEEYRNEVLVWTTDNAQIVSVTEGKIVANRTGTAKITAKAANGESAECTITVGLGEMLPMLEFEFDYEDEITVILSERLNFEGYVVFNGNSFTDVALTYSVIDTGVGTIDDTSGVFTPVSVGETKVTVQATWRGVDSELLTKTFTVKVIN